MGNTSSRQSPEDSEKPEKNNASSPDISTDHEPKQESNDSDPSDSKSSDSDPSDSCSSKHKPRSLNLQRANALNKELLSYGTNSTKTAWIAMAIKQYLIELPRKLFGEAKAWVIANPKKAIFIFVCIALGISAGPILAAVGFGASGVAAGSIAAAIHSMIGNVAAGSLFAVLQSLGATGLLATAGVGFAVAVPGLFWAYYYMKKKITGKEE